MAQTTTLSSPAAWTVAVRITSPGSEYIPDLRNKVSLHFVDSFTGSQLYWSIGEREGQHNPVVRFSHTQRIGEAAISLAPRTEVPTT
jgi:hypothetical protein